MADYVLAPGEPVPGVQEVLWSEVDGTTEVMVVLVENPDWTPDSDLSRWMQTDLLVQRTG